MLETEKFLDRLLVECARLKEFDHRNVFPEFCDANAADEDAYTQRKNVTRALTYLEMKRLVTGGMRVEFTSNLGLATEVRHGTVTRFGRLAVQLPRFARIFLFYSLLKWKALLGVLGTLAFVNLLRNAYYGAMLLAGWLEYASAAVIVWIIYILIRRALN